MKYGMCFFLMLIMSNALNGSVGQMGAGKQSLFDTGCSIPTDKERVAMKQIAAQQAPRCIGELHEVVAGHITLAQAMSIIMQRCEQQAAALKEKNKKLK